MHNYTDTFTLFSQVYVATVPLLTDEQLRQLGVARIGDRAALVQACKRMCLGKACTK